MEATSKSRAFGSTKRALKAMYSSDAQHTKVARDYVRAVIKLNPQLGREHLQYACGASILWLRQRDTEWIEKHLPAPRRGRRKPK